MVHPRENDHLPCNWKPKNGDRRKNPEREMPPEMMKTPSFPGIPSAAPTAPTAVPAAPSAVRTYLLLYQAPEVLYVLLFVRTEKNARRYEKKNPGGG